MADSPTSGVKTIALEPDSDKSGLHEGGCVLYVAEGNDTDVGKHCRLQAERVTIGSAPNCTLVLTDPTVSRQHADFVVTEEGIRVEDLDSTNGVRYLGSRIDSALLPIGAQISVGKTVLALLPLGQGKSIEPATQTTYGDLLGLSVSMRRLFALLQRLEGSEAPVLLLGETGTGKELVARAIHTHSKRGKGPYVVLDCGGLPKDLVESEIFGHVRGAYTGAAGDRAGAFEQAHGGTLFIDEIGELPLDLQPRLLRALESREVKRVGDNAYRRVDVRVVAATHRDLARAVRDNSFREDLYYRLAVVKLRLPPLRDRPEDIPLLARHFAAELGREGDDTLPQELLAVMASHIWPGNVRELRNAVQRLLSLGDLPEQIDSEAGGTTTVDPNKPYKEAREEVVDRFEGAYVEAILQAHDGNISKASRAAGIARTHFKNLMRKHGLVRS